VNPDTPSLLSNDTAIEPMAPPPQPSLIHRIFLGADGLRAGWSLLLFMLMLVGVLFAVMKIAMKIHPPSGHHPPEETWVRMMINEVIPFLAIVLITWIMSKIERRPNSVFGLGGGRKASLFFAGLGWGFACLTLLFAILWRSGLLVIDSRLLYGSDVVRYGAMWLVAFLFVGLLEEYLTRGFMQYTLTRGLAGLYRALFKTRHSEALGFWTAALIFSILFGLGHSGNPGESPLGLVCAGAAGFLFCFSLWRTGSLWWAIGFHTSWDWSQSYLYGVADSGMMVQHHLLQTHPVGKPILSGGTTGPEGSAWVILVMLIAVAIIAITLPRHKAYLAGREARVAQ
jgi:CAAX protease family protein